MARLNDAPDLGAMALVRRLIRDYIGFHRHRIFYAVLCMVVVAATTASQAALMKPVLDKIFLLHDERMLLVVPLELMGVTLLGAVANYYQTLQMRRVGQRIVSDVQIDLFSHLMHADLAMFHDQASGRLISRFTNDIQLMRNAVSTALTGTAKEMLTLIFLVGWMIYLSWKLSLVALVLFPLVINPVMRLSKRMRKIADGTQHQLGEFTAQLDEIFSGARVVKAYHREDYEISRARSTVEGLFKLYMKAIRVQAAASPMMEAIGGISIASVIAYGGHQVLTGQATQGAFFSFMTALLMAYRPVRTMAGLNTNMQEGLAAANRLFKVLDTAPNVQDKENAVPLVVTSGEVRFESVSFTYGGSIPAVESLSISVPAGKMAALVGPSGSGKSTLMNVLMRFYEVEGGRVLIDGQDICDVTLKSLRSHIGLVSQEVMLFDDTVAANIAYGREGASREEVEKAARAADADIFIRALPEGYETRIGPSGVKLSGGQRQRLSIARAMLKNAPILLLDEATSALDTQSERSVQSALMQLMAHRTTLVIAHRLSTVRHADIIYALDHGRLVESGRHDELLAKKGLYADLYHSQFLHEEDLPAQALA